MNSSGRMDFGNYVTERLEHLDAMIDMQIDIYSSAQLNWKNDEYRSMYLQAKADHITHMERERDELKREFGVE